LTRLLGAVVLSTALAVALPAQPTGAEAGSGRVVKEFLEALNRGDIEATLRSWSANPELEVAGVGVFVGIEAVRDYLAAFPRPIDVVSTLAWGGRRYEARILADGKPLLLTFQGSEGVIVYLYVEPDPTPPTVP
jgi:hypothetical protein